MSTFAAGGTLANLGDVVQDPPTPDTLEDANACTLDVSGGFVGTIVAEVCGQSYTFYPVNVWSVQAPQTPLSNITAPGLYKCNISGCVAVRARASKWTSGQATVFLYATPASSLPTTGWGTPVPIPAPGMVDDE